MVWMNEIGAVPWVILALIQAVPVALLGALCGALLPRLSLAARPWAFAALWTLFEGARTLGSYAFPWFFLASSQVRVPVLLQIVSVTGPWGLTFAIALTNGLLGEAWRAREARTRFGWVATAAAVPALLAAGGAAVMGSGTARGSGALSTVGIAQGNVIKGARAYSDTARDDVLRVYADLTRDAATAQNASPLFVAWPETVVPGRFRTDPVLRERISGLARELRTSVLAGSVDVNDEDELLNTAFLIDRSGLLRGRYDKVQLVPVGEFFPLTGLLGPLYARYNNGSAPPQFARGTGNGVLATDPVPGRGARVGVLICFESAFPQLAAWRVKNGAQVIALLTSDQTFGTTAGPQQHADLAALRAVETRRYVVRAASTGVSQIIDPWGRVTRSLGLNRRGALVGPVVLRDDRTLYVRGGDWFLAACAAGLAVLIGLVRRGRAASGPSERSRP
jgi:apolipoprotein N-acyltransferase